MLRSPLLLLYLVRAKLLKFTRPFYLFVGVISLILGVLGIFLPLLPTTPFIILSSLCFSKSSKRMHIWLTSIPLFGDAIMDWEKNKVIRPKAKAAAISMIILSIGFSVIFTVLHYGLKIMLVVIAISVITFILSRNSFIQEQ